MRDSRTPNPTLALIASCSLALTLAGCGVVSEAAPGEEPASPSADSEAPSFLSRLLGQAEVEMTVPEGTALAIRFEDTLSSHQSAPGEPFSARVRQDVSVDGITVIPAGATVLGTVEEARGPEKIGGRARLALDFHTLRLPSGEEVPIAAGFAQSGKSETPKDAAIIGGSTLGGAILGEAVDEGEGTVLGAIVGGLAGAAAAKKTRGKPVTVPAGTEMSLRLEQPLTLTVER